MPSGTFYKIRIGTIWLTSDASENGLQCFLSIPQASELLTEIAGTVIETVGGRVVQSVPYVKGKDFDIQVSIMPADVWDELFALRETLLENDSSIEIEGSARPGNFAVNAKPRPDAVFTFESFDNDFIYNVSMKFYSV